MQGQYQGESASHGSTASASHLASGGVYQTLLLLGAIALWGLLFLSIASAAGCARPHRQVLSADAPQTQPSCYRNVRFIPVLVQASSDRRSSLIFPADAEFTPIPAQDFARSDWPTTPGRYDAGQTVSYQEYWYDSQALTPYTPSYGYRTFTVQRNGMQTGP